MLKQKNKKLNIDETKITKLVFSLFKNKPKGHHDPLFIGNERKYLNHCIKSGYVSYVGNFVKKFENKITNSLNQNTQLRHLLARQPFTYL